MEAKISNKGHNGRRLNEQTKLEILADVKCGEPYSKIAKRWMVSKATINRLANDEKLNRLLDDELNAGFVEKRKLRISSNFLYKMFQATDNMTEDKIKKCSAYQLAGMAGILHQNYRLAENQSTANVSVNSIFQDLGELRNQLKNGV